VVRIRAGAEMLLALDAPAQWQECCLFCFGHRFACGVVAIVRYLKVDNSWQTLSRTVHRHRHIVLRSLPEAKRTLFKWLQSVLVLIKSHQPPSMAHQCTIQPYSMLPVASLPEVAGSSS
jgi:hypothetical protein